MTAETNYFWLNCGYNRWNHNEPLVGQTALFESGAHFNPSQGFRAFKKAKVGDQVIFIKFRRILDYLDVVKLLVLKQVHKIKYVYSFVLMNN